MRPIETELPHMGQMLRALRLELGLSQREAADRARAACQDLPASFGRTSWNRAETRGTGMTSRRSWRAFAAGVGLARRDFEEFMAEEVPIEEAARRSVVRPNPARVAELKALAAAAESEDEPEAPASRPGTPDVDELRAHIEQLEAENAALRAGIVSMADQLARAHSTSAPASARTRSGFASRQPRPAMLPAAKKPR